MANESRLPALRPIEVIPVQRADRDMYYVLRDPAGYSGKHLAVSPVGCFVLAHLTGEHTVMDVQRAFQSQVGAVLPVREIERLVSALDDALLLESARYEAARQARRAAYAATNCRDNRDRYPAGAELRDQLDRIVAQGTPASVGDLRGLIAPHLDYERGAPCYADAYATLRSCPAERYVILGTNHAGEGRGVVATRKDFLTPLGRAAVDSDFLARLELRCGLALCENEVDHAGEHSVELQVHMLQVLHGSSDFRIVPVLCSEVCDAGTQRVTATMAAFADALQSVLGECSERTVVIAGADLSHVGQRFGDALPSTREFLESIAASDRLLLERLERRQEDEVVRQLAETGNPTRVCSAACIYTTLRALPARACRLLRYHQAVDMEAETHVTCAAAVIE